MSNFNFLAQWQEIQMSAQSAENIVRTDPRSSCFYSRRALEITVKWMYRYDKFLNKPYDDKLASLIHDSAFKNSLPAGLIYKLIAIQKTGNLAVHSDTKITERDSLQVLKELHHFLYWFSRTYSVEEMGKASITQTIENEVFSVDKIPNLISIDETIIQQNAKKLRELYAQLETQDKKAEEMLAEKEQRNQKMQQQLMELQEQIASAKLINQQNLEIHPDSHNYNEAETRQFLIDQYLREAGWDLNNESSVSNAQDVIKNSDVTFELEVEGMPNAKSTGYVDYVLWGNDGLPLAIIEAKSTSYSAKKGKQQAVLYANCLEAITRKNGNKQRPLIFYTNGYEIYFWDDSIYPERQLQGFYSQDELQRIINRRRERKNLLHADINKSIAGRYYQEQAIRNICENIQEHNQRKSLLVMATGTGKTRTMIALVDILMRNGWVKNVLFLADRNALLSQAKKEFAFHLPNVNHTILSSGLESVQSRICFATYHTMMNLLNELPEERLFTVGHFDLVIVDEAHRSLYKKYRYIFDYFDSLLIGLTATPKSEVDKNTYDVFGLETGVPTFAYESELAYADGYLVPPKATSVPLKIMREGLKYNELTSAEQEEWEEIDELSGREEVLASEINSFLFNQDTVDKMLEHLMTNGLKTASGDEIAKTIIFSANIQHAEFICERFDANYPKWKGHLARVITYKQDYAETLIDEFKLTTSSDVLSTPKVRIAISVDMLDTGIDVPEVANLVFFKVVRSKVKFLQMIGRGTRLCPDLFGPGQNKQFFKVFDYCQNFEYFNNRPDGAPETVQRSLAQLIFEKRLEITSELYNNSEDKELCSLRDYIYDLLHNDVSGMNLHNFIVRPKRKIVEKYLKRDKWIALSEEQTNELISVVANLPTEAEAFNEFEMQDELAKRFDLILLRMQLEQLQKNTLSAECILKIMAIAEKLEQKSSIPAVAARLELIQEIQTNLFWQHIAVKMLEKIRREIRGLIRFIDKGEKSIIFTNFEDEIGVGVEVEIPSAGGSLAQYRKKMEHFIKNHENQLTIQKLKRNLPITENDLKVLEELLFEASGMQSKEEYKKAFATGTPLGKFVRELVGLDRSAAKEAFSGFLDEAKYNAKQIEFINQIIDFLTINGVMESDALFQPPFTDMHEKSIYGYYGEAQVVSLVSAIKSINDNVMPRYGVQI
ncbi:MAG TPA: DEAD/DEAH box helicase family protein [Gammaproteobacteria bacterium]|nr:DEAD/DEAH box helicase family protein [Gammaproteobacteria bacterium]